MPNTIKPLRHNFSPLVPLLARVDMVAWDCDGTAVDNEKRALDVIRDELKKYAKSLAASNHVFFDIDDIDCCRDLAGKPLPKIREVMSKEYGIHFPSEIDEKILQRRKNSPEPDEVVNPITPFSELAFFLRYYEIPQRIVTSSEPDRAKRYLEAAGVKHLFNGIPNWLFSGHKPLPDAHRAARESLIDTPLKRAANPKRTIGIEDSPSGVQACVNDGIFVIGHVLCSHVSRLHKERHARRLIEAGANEVIMTEQDIVPVFQKILEKMPEAEKTPVAEKTRVFIPRLPRMASTLG